MLLPRGGGSALLEKHVSMSSGAFRRTQSELSSLHAPSARSVPSIQPEGTTSSLVMGRSSGPTILDEVGRRRLKELEGEISSLKEDLEDAKAAQERANRAMRSKDLDTKSMKAELEKERKNHQRTRSLAEDLARTVGQIKGTIQERAAEMAQIQIQSAKVKPFPPLPHTSSSHQPSDSRPYHAIGHIQNIPPSLAPLSLCPTSVPLLSVHLPPLLSSSSQPFDAAGDTACCCYLCSPRPWSSSLSTTR